MRVLAEISESVVGDPRSGSTGSVSFRRLRASDLPLLHRWLNAPHVARWWYGEDTPWRAIEEYWLPHVEVRETVEPYLILREGTPVGYYIRAYERAGFRFFKTIQVSGEPEPEYPMPWTTCSWRGRTASSREDLPRDHSWKATSRALPKTVSRPRGSTR